MLGDLVGYGADPNAVVERVQALKPVAIVRGNHDKVALRPRTGRRLQRRRARAPRSGRSTSLTPEHRDWLAALPQGPLAVDDLVEICHGSPFDEDAYIFDELDALRALKAHVAAALPLRPHALSRHLSSWLAANCRRSGRPPQRRRRSSCRTDVQYLVNPGCGRPAARRRPARRLRDRRHRAETGRAVPARVSGGRGAGEDHRGGAAGGARAAAGGGQVGQIEV